MIPLHTHRNVVAVRKNHPIEFAEARLDLKAKADLLSALDPKTGKRAIRSPFTDDQLDSLAALAILIDKGAVRTDH